MDQSEEGSRKRAASSGASPHRAVGFTATEHPTWGRRSTGKKAFTRSDPYQECQPPPSPPIAPNPPPGDSVLGGPMLEAPNAPT
eukprot:3157368-Karenia_brevis.AAC.1